MFVTLGGIDKAGHMWGAQADAATFTGDGLTRMTRLSPVPRSTTSDARQRSPTSSWVGCSRQSRTWTTRPTAEKPWRALTADHGATFGEQFYGKTGPVGISNSNGYYAPVGVYDAGSTGPPVPPKRSPYNTPSPSLAPLIATGNVQFSYQSTAIETWLIDHSTAEKTEGADAMLEMPGVIASYWRDGDRYRLHGTNAMPGPEKAWWKQHGQELVNSMAAPNGPDLIGLLHDRVSYGVYGDHGGAQQSVQRVPMVFWSPSLAFENDTGAPFKTIDLMPTILDLMGIPETSPTDGTAQPLS